MDKGRIAPSASDRLGSGTISSGSISICEPSPVQRGVLWAGTDDGRLHVSRDSGANWQSVEANIYSQRGVPANTWIPHVAPSPHDAGTRHWPGCGKWWTAVCARASADIRR